MKIKKGLTYCLVLLLACTVLSGCAGNSVSKEAKKLYNEQVAEYEKRAEYLKACLSKDAPTTGILLSYPTSFFHLTVEEKEVYDEADFGEEMKKNLEKGEEISKDAKRLYDAQPSRDIYGNVTQEQYDSLVKTFNELKEKYKDYDYTLKSFE